MRPPPLKEVLTKANTKCQGQQLCSELEQFNLKLEWIQGIKNTLADSLSRLLEVDPEAKLQPEKEGHEFGTFCFENISETGEISPDFWTPLKDTVEHLEIVHNESDVKEVHLPLSTKQVIQLQKNDTEARNIIDKLRKERKMRRCSPCMMVSCAGCGQKSERPSDAFLFLKY